MSKRKKDEKVYKPGRILPIVQHLHKAYEKWITENTTLLEGKTMPKIEDVVSGVRQAFPTLKEKHRCYNCDASMVIKGYNITWIDVELLRGMARRVRMNQEKGMPFHEANKVHVQTQGLYNAIECRTTVARYFGLITMVKTKEGKHDTKAGWLITKRGWDFLKGEPVPRKVHATRNKIVERFPDDTITIDKVKGYTKADSADVEYYYRAGTMVDKQPLL